VQVGEVVELLRSQMPLSEDYLKWVLCVLRNMPEYHAECGRTGRAAGVGGCGCGGAGWAVIRPKDPDVVYVPLPAVSELPSV
jgi:hypothetical protein